MGNHIRKYLNLNHQKEIYFLVFSIACITFFIIINGCGKNESTNKNEFKKIPAQNLSLELNFEGYIKDILKEGSINYLIIDTVELFSGEAATKVFNEDKIEAKNKTNEITNGYYIRNFKIDSVKYKISDNADVEMQTLSYNQSGNYNFNEKIQVSKFISLLNNPEYQRFKFKLYKFHILNNEIDSIKEIYLP